MGVLRREVYVGALDGAPSYCWGAFVKGTPRHVFRTGDVVEVWMDAPTGDSSDVIVLKIPCTSKAGAVDLARVWSEAWGL